MASALHANLMAGTASTDTFDTFLKESAIAVHPDFPVGDLQLESAALVDCLYRVKDAIFNKRMFIPDSMWLYRLLREASAANEPIRSDMQSRIEAIARQRNRRWLVRLLLALSVFKKRLEQFDFKNGCTVDQAQLIVDFAKFGVGDIYDACNLVSKLRPLPIEIPFFNDVGLRKLLGIRRLKRRWTA